MRSALLCGLLGNAAGFGSYPAPPEDHADHDHDMDLPEETEPGSHTLNWQAGFTDTLAREQTIPAGDSITLMWTNDYGSHNVYMMPDKEAFDACDFSDATMLADSSVTEYTFTVAEEPMYFACEIQGHCFGGQKLAVHPY